MQIRNFISVRSALAVFAGALSLFSFAASSGADTLPLGLSPATGAEAGAPANPLDTFPAPTGNVKLLHAETFGVCADDTCTYKLGRVGKGKILTIEKVTCIALVDGADPNKFATLQTTNDLASTGLIAFLTSVLIENGPGFVVTINATGPYYIPAKKKIIVKTGGTAGRCSVSGQLANLN